MQWNTVHPPAAHGAAAVNNFLSRLHKCIMHKESHLNQCSIEKAEWHVVHDISYVALHYAQFGFIHQLHVVVL